MSFVVDSGREVVHQQITVPHGYDAVTEFRVTAPTGKTPMSGGHHVPFAGSVAPELFGSYPDGSDWVFEFRGASTGLDIAIDLYVVCEYA